jgi:hypothetical protein
MDAALLGPSGRTVLKSTVVSIGYSSDNQLIVNDSKVSPHHAEMRLVGQGYCLIDLSSANGTFVNEQRLENGVPRPLNAGDIIRIGDTTFQYAMSGVSQMLPGASATPGQASNTPGVVAPSEFIAGDQVLQEAYPSPLPQQQWYIPLPPAYQSDTSLPPPQQPYWPPAAAGENPTYTTPVQPQSYVQQSNTPPGVPSTVPTYTTPASEPSYTPPSTKRKPGGKMRILLIVLAIILVLGIMGGAGIAAYKLTRPQPVISVTSDYHVGSTPVGSIGTAFHVSGHKFAGTSVITLLLDGMNVPGSSRVASDASGNVRVDVTVTNGWAVGSHILTAKDADGNLIKVAATVIIVPQGQAGTPGPNGAPADDKSFTLDVNMQYQDVTAGKHSRYSGLLTITGRPDPAGGTVCQYEDKGQSQTYQGDAGNGITYTELYATTCSGTYKGGKLSYIETVTSERIDYSDGESCVVRKPFVGQHLEGTFTTPNRISGNSSEGGYIAYCNKGVGTVLVGGDTGTWTGQL